MGACRLPRFTTNGRRSRPPPPDLEQFRDRELESLYQVWLEQKDAIDTKAFAAELAREWSIETGTIEGVYTLDRGTTELLIRRGIDSSYIPRESTNLDPTVVAQIIQAHEDALEGLFDFVTQRRELSTSYIKELHSALLRHQDAVKGVDQFGTEVHIQLKKGAYKEHPNSPTRRDKAVHEYCPPEHVASEMDRLVEFHRQHDLRGVPSLVEAAWLHHAFTQIHPFQDGNGRVARALASLVLIKGRFFPLVVRRDDWERYIDTLESADAGNPDRFISFLARMQKRDLTSAIVRVADAKPVSSVSEAVATTRDLLVALHRIAPTEYARVREIGRDLYQAAAARLNNLAAMLTKEIGTANVALTFRSVNASMELSVLKQLAEKLRYQPNTAEESLNHELIFSAGGSLSRMVVSLHSLGAVFRGLVASAAYFRAGDGEVVPLSEDIFRIDYKDPVDELRGRYLKWLDGCIIRGLAEWRKTLV